MTSPVVLTEEKQRIQIGLHKWKNSNNGFTVFDLEYTADPEKRSDEWKKTTFAGIPKAEREREYGSTWLVYDGKPVYPDYDDEAHKLVGNIIAPRRAKLISGWDGGPNDLYLAWCLGLVYTDTLSITFIDELVTDQGDVEEFVETVGSRLKLEWLKLGGFSIHIVDPAAFTETQLVRGGRSMASIMRQYNMPPIPGEVTYGKRKGAVQKLMKEAMTWVDGQMVPKFRVHERCIAIRSAMKGGYAYPKVAGGVGNVYNPKPIKNEHSHIANAVEYACSRLTLTTQSVPFEGRRMPVKRMLRV